MRRRRCRCRIFASSKPVTPHPLCLVSFPGSLKSVTDSSEPGSLLYCCMRAMKQTLARLALTIPVVWLVVSLVFLLIPLVPGDPILQMLGEGATPADIGALRHQYGLDLPLHTQYIHYWAGVLHGDLG